MHNSNNHCDYLFSWFSGIFTTQFKVIIGSSTVIDSEDLSMAFLGTNHGYGTSHLSRSIIYVPDVNMIENLLSKIDYPELHFRITCRLTFSDCSRNRVHTISTGNVNLREPIMETSMNSFSVTLLSWSWWTTAQDCTLRQTEFVLRIKRDVVRARQVSLYEIFYVPYWAVQCLSGWEEYNKLILRQMLSGLLSNQESFKAANLRRIID